MNNRGSEEERLILRCIEDITNNTDKTTRGCRIRYSILVTLFLWGNVPDISKDCSAFIFRAKQSKYCNPGGLKTTCWCKEHR
jgi:hypothetical protein